MRQRIVGVEVQDAIERRDRSVNIAISVQPLEVAAPLQVEIVGLWHLRAIRAHRVELARLELDVEQACRRDKDVIQQQKRVVLSDGHGVCADLATAWRLHESQLHA
jgi:hypothetical protein|tara:strand:+ start:1441 stop:1758 length:318 start_codon:yes stop_codon:yes gene_type:complete